MSEVADFIINIGLLGFMLGTVRIFWLMTENIAVICTDNRSRK